MYCLPNSKFGSDVTQEKSKQQLAAMFQELPTSQCRTERCPRVVALRWIFHAFLIS